MTAAPPLMETTPGARNPMSGLDSGNIALAAPAQEHPQQQQHRRLSTLSMLREAAVSHAEIFPKLK